MDLVTDASLCKILGFDLDAELSNTRRYLKTSIKYIKAEIQSDLDALGSEVLTPIGDITDKISDSVKDVLSSISDSPLATAAEAIMTCIGLNMTTHTYKLGYNDWKGIFDDWISDILDSYLTSYEKSLWGLMDTLENALSPYTLDKIRAFATCLIGCPGVSGATTPGPDGWGVITPDGWVYITTSDFTSLVNTSGLGLDGKIDFTLFGASGSTYGSRIRTIQDSKNNAVNALSSVANESVAPNDDAQQVIDDYNTLAGDVEEKYAEYLAINLDISELISLANDRIKEVDIYIIKIYRLGTRIYKSVADNGKTKMLSIYTDMLTYYNDAIANDSSAETAYNDLDLDTLTTLATTNSGYKSSSNTDKNRIISLNNIVRDMANALEDKGTVGGSYSGGTKIRGRAPIKSATGTGSYQESIDNV